MKLVIFGPSVSSAWGNGHATLWRGSLRALASGGHRVVFFERDTPFHAAHRDRARGAGYEIVAAAELVLLLESAPIPLPRSDASAA
jgi:spore maturation protein CgeB